jgi:hypothetical protein
VVMSFSNPCCLVRHQRTAENSRLILMKENNLCRHGAQSPFLDLHLRKGSTKDDQYCLAIDFFWDDQEQQVVVGWLPGHLDNRMTQAVCADARDGIGSMGECFAPARPPDPSLTFGMTGLPRWPAARVRFTCSRPPRFVVGVDRAR